MGAASGEGTARCPLRVRIIPSGAIPRLIIMVMAFPMLWRAVVFLSDPGREPALPHDHRCWLHDHGLRGDDDWGGGSNDDRDRERHPNAHGYLGTTRMGRERQGKTAKDQERTETNGP